MADIKTLLGDKYTEGMSNDDIVSALQGITLPDMAQFVPKSDYDKLKIASDKNASEAKSYKDKYNEKLSADERQKEIDEEARKATENRLAELERKDKISTTKDKYIASGFSAELAMATAEAFVDGKMDVVLANITKHATDVATAAKDEALKGTPAPPASGNPNPGKIDYDVERDKAIANNDFTLAAYYERQKIEQK